MVILHANMHSACLSLLASGLLIVPACAHDHAPVKRTLEFHENLGQWPKQVLYRAITPGGALFVEPDAFTHVLRSGGPQHGRPAEAAFEPYREHAYRARFIGGRAESHRGVSRMGHYANYFIGNDPSQWAGGVGVFEGAVLEDVYPGIDLVVSGAEGLKYDWRVAAGADASMIVLEFEGQDAIRVEDGLLYVRTSAGNVIEQRPVAWQEKDGARIPVRCDYAIEGNHVRYDFPDGTDRRFPLVIDPIVVFSSYTGSFADNFGYTATYDGSGHLYGGGSVFGAGYPTTLGVLQTTHNGGTIDMGITKFSPDGSSLVWSTYIGGSANDLPHSMVVNSDDELYILGTSGSSDFPVSAGCYDASFGGGSSPPFGGSYGFTFSQGTDIVVVHLNATATGLAGSTFVGGSANDGLNQYVPLLRNYGDPFRGEIIMDEQDRPIIATSTASTDLFTSPGASQSANAGGLDAYVFRMDPGLTGMLWATYFGGSGNDAGFGVQISSTAEVYITGGTLSTNLPMAGTPANAASAGDADGYIARFAPDGSALLSATYLGTSGFDQSYFVQLDTQNDVYVVGQTTGNYPVTPGKYANPSASQFLHKFSNDLSTSLWSTRIAGTQNSNISPSAFLVSLCGQIYFSGWGGSVNPAGGGLTMSSTLGLPVTTDAYQPGTDGSDFYLMVLDPEAVSLAYATFFGGTASEHVDGGTSRFDKNGIVYQAVCAGCGFGTTFPTTPGAWSNTDTGVNCNLGVFKMDFEQNVQVSIDADITSQGSCITEPISFNAVGTADEWLWDLGDGSPTSPETSLAHLYSEPGTYTITLVGIASGLCVAVDTATLEITVVEPADLQPSFDAVPSGSCDAFSVQLSNTSTGSIIYHWQFGDGSTSNQANPVHPYGAPGEYEITLGLIDAICGDTAFTSLTIPISVPGLDLELATPVAMCEDVAIFLSAGAGYDSYAWSNGATGETISVDDPGDYVVVVTDGFCTGTDTITVFAQPTHALVPDVVVCPGQTAVLTLGDPVLGVEWSTGDTTTILNATVAGNYWFDAVDRFGCAWTDTIHVTVIAQAVGAPIIPNVFSPNGDAQNPVFLVKGVDAANFRLEVFDRWGIKMFSSSNSGTGWNGKLDNSGESVPDGTYYYILTFQDDCSRIPLTTHTGHVTLLR